MKTILGGILTEFAIINLLFMPVLQNQARAATSLSESAHLENRVTLMNSVRKPSDAIRLLKFSILLNEGKQASKSIAELDAYLKSKQLGHAEKSHALLPQVSLHGDELKIAGLADPIRIKSTQLFALEYLGKTWSMDEHAGVVANLKALEEFLSEPKQARSSFSWIAEADAKEPKGKKKPEPKSKEELEAEEDAKNGWIRVKYGNGDKDYTLIAEDLPPDERAEAMKKARQARGIFTKEEKNKEDNKTFPKYAAAFAIAIWIIIAIAGSSAKILLFVPNPNEHAPAGGWTKADLKNKIQSTCANKAANQEIKEFCADSVKIDELNRQIDNIDEKELKKLASTNKAPADELSQHAGTSDRDKKEIGVLPVEEHSETKENRAGSTEHAPHKF